MIENRYNEPARQVGRHLESLFPGRVNYRLDAEVGHVFQVNHRLLQPGTERTKPTLLQTEVVVPFHFCANVSKGLIPEILKSMSADTVRGRNRITLRTGGPHAGVLAE